jgi:N-methylhydantoinase A
LKKPEMKLLRNQIGTPKSTGKRRVRFETGWAEVPVYDRDNFGQGCRIIGPALIEEASSATILCADQSLAVDPYGNLLITA